MGECKTCDAELLCAFLCALYLCNNLFQGTNGLEEHVDRAFDNSRFVIKLFGRSTIQLLCYQFNLLQRNPMKLSLF